MAEIGNLFTRNELGNAERQRDGTHVLSGRALHDLLGLHGLADVVRNRQGMFERRLGQDDDEFLATKPRREIFAFHVGTQALANEPQHLVANRVAVRVIEFLEMIDVRNDEAHRAAFGDGCIDRAPG